MLDVTSRVHASRCLLCLMSWCVAGALPIRCGPAVAAPPAIEVPVVLNELPPTLRGVLRPEGNDPGGGGMLPSVARRGGAPIGVGDGGDLIGFGGEGVGAAVSGCFVDTAEGIRGLHEGFTEVLRAGATAAAGGS